MKVALVYTGVTKELTQMVEAEVKKQIGECDVLTLSDPSIINDAVKAGYVTRYCTARLVSMYMDAINQDADAILNICSSVGDVADASQDLAKLTGVPIVRIDEEMCREAVRQGRRIGVMATLRTTLDPTRNTVLRVAREMDKRVEMVDVLVEGGFGLDPKQFLELMAKYANEIADKVDVILFAQGSMAYAEDHIREVTGKVILSSPRFGALALKRALEVKGLI